MFNLDAYLDDNGKCRAYAWPGGYPIYFVTTDGAVLCPGCIDSERESIVDSIANNSRDGWQVEGADINWECAQLTCDHCGARIESAYNDTPNFDGMDCEELTAYAQDETNDSRLREYCACAVKARGYRLAGDIGLACGMEAMCDRIYDKLPEHLRW